MQEGGFRIKTPRIWVILREIAEKQSVFMGYVTIIEKLANEMDPHFRQKC